MKQEYFSLFACCSVPSPGIIAGTEQPATWPIFVKKTKSSSSGPVSCNWNNLIGWSLVPRGQVACAWLPGHPVGRAGSRPHTESTSPRRLYFWSFWEMSSGSNWRYRVNPVLGKGDPDFGRLGGLVVNILNILGRNGGLEGVPGPCRARDLGGMGYQNAGSWCDSWVGLDGVMDPLCEPAEVGVDARFVGLSTGKVSPGHEALQSAMADHGAPRVTLRGTKGGTKRGRGVGRWRRETHRWRRTPGQQEIDTERWTKQRETEREAGKERETKRDNINVLSHGQLLETPFVPLLPNPNLSSLSPCISPFLSHSTLQPLNTAFLLLDTFLSLPHSSITLDINPACT